MALCAVMFALMSSAVRNVDWAALNALARDEARVPIRAGVPGKVPFWNVKSRAFMHPPAFDFRPFDDAKKYRFTLTEVAATGKQFVWTAKWPWATLDAEVWDGLLPGYYTVKVEGVAADGRNLGASGERTFYRAAVFEGPYSASAGDYRMAARRVYASVFRSSQVQAWLSGETPPKGYDLYCYPAKILSSMVRALCRHAQSEPKDAESALLLARKMADWMMLQSQPEGTPLAHFPPTYWGDRRDVAVKNAGRNMLGYPAQAALAYFDLWNAVGEVKYREAALAIGRTYVRIQGSDGSWPLLVMEKDGTPVGINRLVPERYVLGLLDRAYAVTKENAFKRSAERAFEFVTRGPCKTWNWDGQFEDVEPKPPYANLQKGVAVDAANRIFATGGDKTLACELIDWCEDQFVVWSKPVHNMDWKHWKTPTALEQYEYYTPIDASMGDMIGGWANAYRATGNVLYLMKACALADNIVRNQRVDGTIPTYFDSRKGSDWVNCMVYVADRLEVLAGMFSASAVHGGPKDCAANNSSCEDIRPCAMRTLPLGSISPEGHLRERLELQAKGLTGHAEELYDDIGRSDWLTNAGRGGQYSWERGPYYARGLIALAFTLGDETLKEKAKKWIEAVYASQKANGDIGPRKDNWWANMIPQWYLRDWADATGDDRVLSLLERYYAYQMEEFKTVPLEKEGCWACARGGDEIDAILWLYGKTGDAKWLNFARQVAASTADWTTYYYVGGDPGRNAPGCGGYRCHIVNFMQGLKFPAMKWLLGGNETDRTAYAAAFDPDGWVMRKCGRPDGMVNGSEPLTDRSASAGTELCAIAERIISIQKTVEAFGDAAPADDLEDVAYNSLAATVTKDMKGIRYYLLLNQPMCVDKGLMFANNGFGAEITGANCPGPHSGFGCCRSNWHVAWPKFVQTMWMLKDDGIAAVVHGPSSVTAKLPCGEVTLREETEYPRSGKVTMRIVKGGGTFPIYVRIPRWAKVPDAGTFRKYERTWKTGDAVEFDFPMEISLSYWASGAVAVRRGPLLYALKIDEGWQKVQRYKVPYEKRWIEDGGGDFPRWEIRPKSPWNYALVLNDGALKDAEIVDNGAAIRVKAVRSEAAGWGYMRSDAPGRAVDPPQSPMNRRVCTAVKETVTLVPIGDTQLRVTLFPWIDK